MDFSSRFDNLGLGQENRLRISVQVPLYGEGPTFRDHKLIGTFQIDDNLEYRNDAPIPLLISEKDQRGLIGIDLNPIHPVLIENYSAYHELKHKYFMKFLKENQVLNKISEKTMKKPDFICLGGRITDSLLSPYTKTAPNGGEWKIFGTRVHDMIFLWDEKVREDHHDVHTEYGITFSHLMTDNDGKKIPNEKNEVFVINELSFGAHQLICLNLVDSEDGQGGWTEIKLSKNGLSGFQSRLKCWAQSAIPGINKFIIGTHDKGKVTEIKTKTIPELNVQKPEKVCRLFQDKLLTWMKGHFRVNDKGVVKEFSRARGSGEVIVRNATAAKLTFDIEL